MPTAAARALRSLRSGANEPCGRGADGGAAVRSAPPDRERNGGKMNYTLSEIARICGGTFTGEDRRVTEVVTDSRSCGMPAAPLFVAMCGARHDSHDFVDGMYARGVRAFLVERPLDERDGAGYVVVGNAIDALRRLARRPWRRRFGGGGGGDHRLERQDGRRGVDRPDRRPTARSCSARRAATIRSWVRRCRC